MKNKHHFELKLGVIKVYYHSPKYSNPKNPITNKLLIIKLFNKLFYHEVNRN